MDSSTNQALPDTDVGIYECEVRLKFRIIEEQLTMTNQDELVETLVDAFAYGSDEYMEALDSQVAIQQLQDVAKLLLRCAASSSDFVILAVWRSTGALALSHCLQP